MEDVDEAYTHRGGRTATAVTELDPVIAVHVNRGVESLD